MQNKLFLKAADICELLEVKQTSAYEIIGNLNKELEEQGYLTLRGKVPTKYPRHIATAVSASRSSEYVVPTALSNLYPSGGIKIPL